jgi:phosphotriesterase-related protein
VDVTLSDIGRDPVALQVVSRATGIHIVAGCGHYIKEAHPPSLAIESVEAVADRLVAEIVEGIDLTGVKAGIIGEIGVSDPVHKDEEKVLRAAAIAQRSTGVPISLHVLTGNGHHVLDILEDAGAALARVIVGHQDLLLGYPGAREEEVAHYHLSLAERGVYIQFDCFGKDHYFPRLKGYSEAFWAPSDRERCRALKRLLDAGLGDKLLLSHDICHKIELVAYGGFGYGHLLRTVPQNCADAGIPPEDLLRLITDNPAQVLSIALPELVEAKT